MDCGPSQPVAIDPLQGAAGSHDALVAERRRAHRLTHGVEPAGPQFVGKRLPTRHALDILRRMQPVALDVVCTDGLGQGGTDRRLSATGNAHDHNRELSIPAALSAAGRGISLHPDHRLAGVRP